MSLFGHLVDGEAATKAIPFCRALIHLAGAANDDKLRVFISDELLPCLIRLIDDQLPCAIRCLVHKLNSVQAMMLSRILSSFVKKHITIYQAIFMHKARQGLTIYCSLQC